MRVVHRLGFRDLSTTIFHLLNLSQDFLDGVSSHAMANIGNYIWLYGGLTFSKGPLDTLARYIYCHITLVKPLPENN